MNMTTTLPLIALLIAGAGGIPVSALAQRQPEPIKQQAARVGAAAASETLLAATQAGPRIVAVGDHGTVMLSDDGGGHFRQARSVPTRAVLTAVSFADGQHGWAAGHWGTIIKTSDGGETWTLQRSDTAVDRPLFGIHFSDASHGTAAGLWSLLLTTRDGGATWKETSLPAPPEGGKADRNLLGMFGSGQSVYIAAERGMVLRSADQGGTWTYLDTGYKGSFWTGLALKDGTLLVAGLRGTVYRSGDDGQTWTAVASGSKSSITGMSETAAGVVAVGLDGVVLTSVDGGRGFVAAQRVDRLAFTAVTSGGAGQPLGFTRRGAVSELLPAAK